MNFLLDTNIVSEGMRPRPDTRVAAWLKGQSEGSSFLSVMSVAELRQGVSLADPSRKLILQEWIERRLLPSFDTRILDVTIPIANVWGGMAAAVRRRGVAIEAVDAFIAATARVHSLTVVTRNVRDFVPFGVEILNPFELS